MPKKYATREAIETLLSTVDPRMISVLDKFVEEKNIKGWSRFHDELHLYPIGEYNDHLNQVIVNFSEQLEIGQLPVIVKDSAGWEYVVSGFSHSLRVTPDGKFVDCLMANPAATLFHVYDVSHCQGKNLPPEAWKYDGILRMNTEGFSSGDGIDSMCCPETQAVYQAGDACPVCKLWNVETTLVKHPRKKPVKDSVTNIYGYCPRQIIRKYSRYSHLPEYARIVADMHEIVQKIDA